MNWIPEATAAADPLELPPGGYCGLTGFRAVPCILYIVTKI